MKINITGRPRVLCLKFLVEQRWDRLECGEPGDRIGKDSPWLVFIGAWRLFGSESKRERVKAGMLVAKRRDQTAGRPKLIFGRELVKRLSEEGKSSREIAVKLEIGRGTVQRLLAGPKG
jgi:hypothetical protein